MDDPKIESLLLRLLEDMAVVKNKLELLEEIKVEQKEVLQKVGILEDKVATHKAKVKSLEKRMDDIEEYLKSSLIDRDKNNKSIFISVGLCIFTACVNILFSLFTK